MIKRVLQILFSSEKVEACVCQKYVHSKGRITQNFRDLEEKCKLFSRMLAFDLLRQYITRLSNNNTN